jgi:acyl-ACP thioesterase
MKPLSRKDTYRIYWYDADITGTVKASAICNYLQESAWRHASELGFGFEDMKSNNQVWVIISFKLKMEMLPRWGDKIIVETWPRKLERLLAMRDFEIKSLDGEPLGVATSSWMVLDMDTRRPCRVDKLESLLNHTQNRMALSEDAPLLKNSDKLDLNFEHQVQYSEIDHNGHVNNTRYIDWCYNSIPSSFHRQRQFHELTVNYLSEVRENEVIQIKRNDTNTDPTLFQGSRPSNDKKVFRAEISWKDRN